MNESLSVIKGVINIILGFFLGYIIAEIWNTYKK
jgi:hypothetical protein